MKNVRHPALAYRPEIDGLRAIAVLSVVLYHLKVSFTPGGFVGVDIFFVISGYLITSLISKQMQAGTYSIADFYHRRARRIFPALFFLFACCIGIAIVALLPYEVAQFKDSLLPAALFISNIYFYETTDYFAQIGFHSLLLHTWSLSVEEQFYILFPLLLLLVRRLAGYVEKPIFIGLTILSLATSAWLVSTNQTAAFYLLQSRAWELLIGSLLAINAVPTIRNKLLSEVTGGLGILLILFSVTRYSGELPFPGFYALTPCLGAAFIIQSSRERPTYTSRFLSIRLLRFIGLISYSLYLWHWPIKVIGPLFFTTKFGKIEKLSLLALSFACATLSWYFIERPFRRPPFYLSRNRVLGLSGMMIAGFIGIGLLLPTLSDLHEHLPDNVQRILEARNSRISTRPASPGHTCFVEAALHGSPDFDPETCLKLANDKPNFLLLGDSHAAHLWAGLTEVFPNINFMEATTSGCEPYLNSAGERRCDDIIHFILTEYIPQHHVDAILISANWKGGEIDNIKATVALAKPYATHVIVMGPTVEYEGSAPRLLATSILKNDPTLMDRYRRTERRDMDTLFQTAFKNAGIEYISVYRTICPDSHCATADDTGLPIEFDYGHLTRGGPVLVARQIKETGLFPKEYTGPATPLGAVSVMQP